MTANAGWYGCAHAQDTGYTAEFETAEFKTAELVVCVSVHIVVLVSKKPNLIRTKGGSGPRSVKVVHYTQTDSRSVKQIGSYVRM